MGWHSYEIFGGDPPHDFANDIAKICGVKHHSRLTWKSLERRLENVLDYINQYEDDDQDEDKMICYQVLGVLMMGTGAKINKELKEKMIESAKNDYWSKESRARKRVMNNFIKKIEKYRIPNKKRENNKTWVFGYSAFEI